MCASGLLLLEYGLFLLDFDRILALLLIILD